MARARRSRRAGAAAEREPGHLTEGGHLPEGSHLPEGMISTINGVPALAGRDIQIIGPEIVSGPMI